MRLHEKTRKMRADGRSAEEIAQHILQGQSSRRAAWGLAAVMAGMLAAGGYLLLEPRRNEKPSPPPFTQSAVVQPEPPAPSSSKSSSLPVAPAVIPPAPVQPPEPVVYNGLNDTWRVWVVYLKNPIIETQVQANRLVLRTTCRTMLLCRSEEDSRIVLNKKTGRVLETVPWAVEVPDGGTVEEKPPEKKPHLFMDSVGKWVRAEAVGDTIFLYPKGRVKTRIRFVNEKGIPGRPDLPHPPSRPKLQAIENGTGKVVWEYANAGWVTAFEDWRWQQFHKNQLVLCQRSKVVLLSLETGRETVRFEMPDANRDVDWHFGGEDSQSWYLYYNTPYTKNPTCCETAVIAFEKQPG